MLGGEFLLAVRGKSAGLLLPAPSRYFAGMVTRLIRVDGFVAPCIPSLANKPPSGPDWVHEIKHDAS